jgi:hypothetical protein
MGADMQLDRFGTKTDTRVLTIHMASCKICQLTFVRVHVASPSLVVNSAGVVFVVCGCHLNIGFVCYLVKPLLPSKTS